jgi:hypothetical protein
MNYNQTTSKAIAMQNHILFLIALMVLSLKFGNAAAEADGPDYYKVTGISNGDVFNIRSAPNYRAAKIGQIPPQASCIRNRGCQGGLTFSEYSTLSEADKAKRLKQNPRWCKIDYENITGWVAGRYLAEGGCP